ncbi:MAG: DUF4258 domain-containing protein [Geminicoccaceae bacterium]
MRPQLVFRSHAVRRMFERQVTVADIRQIVETGETIENRPNDPPYPSRLVLGSAHGRPLHIVVAEQTDQDTTIIVTVYEPDLGNWHPGFRKRRKP